MNLRTEARTFFPVYLSNAPVSDRSRLESKKSLGHELLGSSSPWHGKNPNISLRAHGSWKIDVEELLDGGDNKVTKSHRKVAFSQLLQITQCVPFYISFTGSGCT
jgi:hypothetical protein